MQLLLLSHLKSANKGASSIQKEWASCGSPFMAKHASDVATVFDITESLGVSESEALMTSDSSFHRKTNRHMDLDSWDLLFL